MKIIYLKGCAIFRIVSKATAATVNVCLGAAKKESFWILACALGGSLLAASVSFVNAKVVAGVGKIIWENANAAIENQTHSLGEILVFLSVSGLLFLAIMYGLLASVNYFVRLLVFLTTTNWGNKVRYEVDRRIRVHRKLLDIGRLRSAEYENIKARIMEQPYGWAAIENHAKILAQFSANFFNLIIFGLGLLFFNPWYALWLFLSVAVRAVSEFYWGNRWWAFNDAETPFSRRRGVFTTLFSNVYPLYDLKYFGKASTVDAYICNSQAAHLKRKNKIIRGDAFWSVLTELVTSIVLIAVITHAIYFAVIKRDIALLVLTLDFSLRFVYNLKEVLFDLSSGWKATRSVAVITDEFFGLQPLIPHEGTGVPEDFGRFNLRDVHFTYPGSPNAALRGVSFSFPVGSKVALVGESGGGKSTIASLLCRQYEPTSGGIYLDNLNLRYVHPEKWFDTCLFMGQDFAIPHVTILEAICYGKWAIGEKSVNGHEFGIGLGLDCINMHHVRDACRRASLLDVIEALPQGFNSLIGSEQGGIELSKGQRQRLAIAARLMAERDLMIYDEPDAALDNTNKEIVIKGILETKSTVVLVVHNLRACEKCDLVVFVKDGMVAEQGTHDELLAQNGLYAEMYRKQVSKK